MNVSIAAIFLAVAAGCTPAEPVGHVPETVGVVKAQTLVGTDLRFELANGRVFTNPANFDYIGGSQPGVNDLLLAGSTPQPWVYRATPEGQTPPGGPICYALFGPTRAVGAQIHKTVEDAGGGHFLLVFEKAPEWKDIGRNGDELSGAKTCINEAGRAFEQRFASAEG